MKLDGSTWGFGLFVVFVVFILSLVFLASIQKVDLITETYYEEELDFQKEREQISKTQKAGKNVEVEWRDHLLLMDFFPRDKSKYLQGIVYFYKPDDKENDQTLVFTTTNDTVELDTSQMPSGLYKLKVKWEERKINNKSLFLDGYTVLLQTIKL